MPETRLIVVSRDAFSAAFRGVAGGVASASALPVLRRAELISDGNVCPLADLFSAAAASEGSTVSFGAAEFAYGLIQVLSRTEQKSSLLPVTLSASRSRPTDPDNNCSTVVSAHSHPARLRRRITRAGGGARACEGEVEPHNARLGLGSVQRGPRARFNRLSCARRDASSVASLLRTLFPVGGVAALGRAVR